MRKHRPSTRLSRSWMEATLHAPQQDAWSAITTGLAAAGHLEALFPDFYATYVADRPTTPRALLGVVQAFFSLAQQQVELLLSEELDTNPSDPLVALEPGDTIDDVWARDILAEHVGRDVHELWPVVYGLEDAEEALFDFGIRPYLAAAVCWALAAETAWAMPFVACDSLIPAVQRQLYQHRIDPAILARLDDLPRLPADVPMEALCDALDAEPPLAGCSLGQALRYCFHATGNQFADLSYAVVAQMASSNLDWRDEDLAEIGRQQRAARQLAESFDQLNAAALRRLDVLDELIARVMSAAQRLAQAAPALLPA